MEAHLTQVLNGIARSMAPAGLKEASVQQRLLPGLLCGDQLFKDIAQDRVQHCVVDLRPADGGSVGGSAEDGVSSGIQRRTVDQIVDLLALVLLERISVRNEVIEVPKISWSSCPRADDTTSADVTTVAKLLVNLGFLGSQSTVPRQKCPLVKLGLLGPEQVATVPPLQQP